MKRIVLLFLLFFLGFLSGAEAFRPDSDTLKKLELELPAWKLLSSSAYPLKNTPLPNAWRLLFARDIIVKQTKENPVKKGYLILYLLPEKSTGTEASRLTPVFDWNMPENALMQYSMYLGRGRGYHWYAKTDIGRLNFLRERFGLKDGDDMMRRMAEALNDTDYDLYSSRVGVEYFRKKGDAAVPYLLKSIAEWEQEHSDGAAPIPQILALKLAGGEKASAELLKIARSRKRAAAEYAVECLLMEPYSAPDSFYRLLLRHPSYTEKAVRVFRSRNAGKSIVEDLRKLAEKPRSLKQYSVALAALREFRSGTVSFPEYDAANHVMFRMMRMGETPGTPIYVSLGDTELSPAASMDKAERKRIAPFLEQLLKSRDPELAFVASFSLAAYDPQDKAIADAYVKRVRQVGLELLKKLPPDLVRKQYELLDRSITDRNERKAVIRIGEELGFRRSR